MCKISYKKTEQKWKYSKKFGGDEDWEQRQCEITECVSVQIA